jgi:uncharacterized protein Yka (UPF0111/DUF47 family)
MKEIIKIKNEIDKIKMQRINEMKSWFLERINKTDLLLAN